MAYVLFADHEVQCVFTDEVKAKKYVETMQGMGRKGVWYKTVPLR